LDLVLSLKFGIRARERERMSRDNLKTEEIWVPIVPARLFGRRLPS
jgi:hypothetical protein